MRRAKTGNFMEKQMGPSGLWYNNCKAVMMPAHRRAARVGASNRLPPRPLAGQGSGVGVIP